MRYLPIFIDTRHERVVLSGGGERALAKLRTLVKCEARIEVFAAEASPALRRLAEEGAVTLIPRPLAAQDLAGAALVYAAEAAKAANARVRALAVSQATPVNVVDDLESSRFLSPALVDRAPVVVAIGTEGAAPVLARRLKAAVERMLAPNVGALAGLARQMRPMVRRRLPDATRRAFWSWFFEGAGERMLARHGAGETRRRVRHAIRRHGELAPANGRVILIGAGPGDPELLTGKARKQLENADVVLHDRLIDARILDLARREALVIEVGKTPGGPAWSQSDINQEMVAHATQGKTVARLKSGDPMMFGRADEELDALDAAGVEVEVIPGITAAHAAAARIGSSLTRRGRNSAITFMTGQDARGYAEQDWRALARGNATVAIYMGMRAARFVQGRLLLHGRSEATEVTVVVNASKVGESIVSGTLGTLDRLIDEHAMSGPGIIYIGIAPRPSVLGTTAAEFSPPGVPATATSRSL